MPRKVSQEFSDSQKDMFYKEHYIQTTEYWVIILVRTKCTHNTFISVFSSLPYRKL
jgi:hypothetical protein